MGHDVGNGAAADPGQDLEVGTPSCLVAVLPLNASRDIGAPIRIHCSCGRSIATVVSERRPDGTYRLAESGNFIRSEFDPTPAEQAVGMIVRGPRSGGAAFWVEGDDMIAAEEMTPAILQHLRHEGVEVPDAWGPAEVIALLRRKDAMPRRRSIPEVLPGTPGSFAWVARDPRPSYLFVCGCGQEYPRKANQIARTLYGLRPPTWFLSPDGNDGAEETGTSVRRRNRRPRRRRKP